ncbi:hypothetical protein EC988_006127, partial [Linderina pennispora]
MSFFVGLTAALLGNVVIGTGQCLQKYALNKLQREWETRRVEHSVGTSVAYEAGYSSSLDIRSRSNSLTGPSFSQRAVTAAQPSENGPRPRYTEKLWIVGLLMNYAGELFGNSVALSYLSASVVAPLGIIAVIVNMVLAERFLGERITPNQRYGFMVIMAGVGCILLVAPRKAAADDAVQFIEVVSTSGILGLFGLFYIVQAALITLIRSGRQSLFLYVLVASLFGSMNVMVSKILTMFMRLRLSYSAIPNPADIVFYGAVEAAKVRPALL